MKESTARDAERHVEIAERFPAARDTGRVSPRAPPTYGPDPPALGAPGATSQAPSGGAPRARVRMRPHRKCSGFLGIRLILQRESEGR